MNDGLYKICNICLTMSYVKSSSMDNETFVLISSSQCLYNVYGNLLASAVIRKKRINQYAWNIYWKTCSCWKYYWIKMALKTHKRLSVMVMQWYTHTCYGWLTILLLLYSHNRINICLYWELIWYIISMDLYFKLSQHFHVSMQWIEIQLTIINQLKSVDVHILL